MFKLLLSFLVVLGVVNASVFPKVDDRVHDLVRKMNRTEKLSLIAGMNGIYTGNTPAIEHLGIPALKMQDGPQGFRTARETGGSGTSTAWPSAMTLASSWDADLLHRWAVAMAEEFAGKGANMALAPGIGIARVPTAGRNFEYLCGEDPILGAKLVGPVVRGLQENGIIADAKHFVNNEIETNRMTVSANVDERSQFEIYYPPFQAAVDAGVLTAMCAYNRVNDVYACENPTTLSHLRDDLGFTGWVVSDWTAAKSTARSLKAGMDMEMPVGLFYSDIALSKAEQDKNIDPLDIDRAVGRILSVMDRMHLLNGENQRVRGGDPMANVTSDAHNSLARELSAQSTVLLKNGASVLPLKANQLGDCIAVIGDLTTVSGDGSGHVDAPYVITPVQGIQEALLRKGVTTTEVRYADGTDLSAATALASSCKVSVVSVAVISGEGNDRADLSLGSANNDLVAAVAAVSTTQTIVAMKIPGAVLMPWWDSVSTVLSQWMPGQEAGNALADVLFGDVNPSARLPVTMPNIDNEVAFTPEEYPGTGHPPEAAYHEALLIGYRWYDAHQVTPRLPFGHGLSYTTFSYSPLQVHLHLEDFLVAEPVVSAGVAAHPRQPLAHVSLLLQNTGALDGAEIVQMYLQYPASAQEPPRQLRDFVKVPLTAGARKEVTLTLTQRDCAVWDVQTRAWTIPSGQFTVLVGASSQDIRAQATFTL